jgi:hypothetical protein
MVAAEVERAARARSIFGIQTLPRTIYIMIRARVMILYPTLFSTSYGQHSISLVLLLELSCLSVWVAYKAVYSGRV